MTTRAAELLADHRLDRERQMAVIVTLRHASLTEGDLLAIAARAQAQLESAAELIDRGATW